MRSHRLCALLILLALPASDLLPAEMPASLRARFARLPAGSTIPVVVTFTGRPGLGAFTEGKRSAPAMIRALKKDADRSIARLDRELRREGHDVAAAPLWIAGAALLAADASSIVALEKLPFVAAIGEDGEVYSEVVPFVATAASGMAEWGLQRLNADSVWLLYGIDGTDVLIGSMDTGVDTSHASIGSKWRGGTNSWFDAIAGRTSPYDDLAHGTQTTGILVGGDGPGPDVDDIGAAYGATYIAAKMLTGGFAANSQVITAAQWMLDPDGDPSTNDFPDVVNNSWFSNTRGSTWFYAAAAAWRAAGIIPVFCAANFGPAIESTRSPGDYDICLSVGGTNSADNRYAATSVGPSPIGASFPADRRKPDVSAPGEGVRTSTPGGGFAGASGTSMAAPHVTATVALMLQANPDLTYGEVYEILAATSADLGTTGYDFVFGYGRIDALEAVREALRYRVSAGPETAHVTSESGDTATLSVRLRVAPTSAVVVRLTIDDASEGELASDSLLVFLPGSWDAPQNVAVRGLPDALSDGDVAYALRAETESGDVLYDGLALTLATMTNLDVPVLGVDEPSDRPGGFALLQNYPNPFNPLTVIRYEIPVESRVTLTIYDLLGSVVAVLEDDVKQRGVRSAVWDAADRSSGVYVCRLQAAALGDSRRNFTQVRTLLLLK